MDDSFLEEQLKRIRRLTQDLSEMHNRVAENVAQLSRPRDGLRNGRLQSSWRRDSSDEPAVLHVGVSSTMAKPGDAAVERVRIRRAGRNGSGSRRCR